MDLRLDLDALLEAFSAEEEDDDEDEDEVPLAPVSIERGETPPEGGSEFKRSPR